MQHFLSYKFISSFIYSGTFFYAEITQWLNSLGDICIQFNED